MKLIKVLLISLLISFVIYIAFRKKDKIDLRGNWIPTKIIINGKDNLSKDSINLFFKNSNKIEIRGWQDSLYILTANKYNAAAKIKVQKNDKGENQVILSSKEHSMTGNFKLEIDTIHIGPESYRVYVKIISDHTEIHFHREVNIPPWKPEFPHEGQV